MGNYLSEEDYVPLKVFEKEGKKSLTDKRATIQVFEKISQEIRAVCKEFLCEDAFAATESLLSAVKRRLLSWQQLRSLVLNKVDYGAIYPHFDIALEDRFETWSFDPYDRSTYISLLWHQYHGVFNYLQFIDALTHVLMRKQEPSPFTLNEDLEGKAPKYWISDTWYDRVALQPVSAGVAESYEERLGERKDFKAGLGRLRHMVNRPRWRYVYSENCLYRVTDRKPRGGENHEGVELRKREEQALRTFCSRWCVECLGQDSRKEPLFFSAMTVRVQPRFDNTGCDVFIPRYYRYSHLVNHSDEDFAPLKRALDEVFVSYKMPRKRKSQKQKVEKAKSFRAELKQQGISKFEVWERTRKEMGWKASTMKKHLGEQPEDPNAGKSVTIPNNRQDRFHY